MEMSYREQERWLWDKRISRSEKKPFATDSIQVAKSVDRPRDLTS